jgi:hypothetical protein
MNSLTCSCCGKQRDLTPVGVDMIGKQQLLLCIRCFTHKHKPRWLIVLAARRGVSNTVRSAIKNERYCGDKILAEEVV